PESSVAFHPSRAYILSPIHGALMKAYYWIALLAVAGVVWGQPEAPVEWGEARWFEVGNYYNYSNPAILWGDTLVFARMLADDSTTYYRPAVIYSHDNGQTFSSWQVLDNNLSDNPFLALFGVRQNAFALVQGWLDRSMDAGISWHVNRMRPSGWYIRWGTGAGQTVIVLEQQFPNDDRRMVISTDGGDSWNSPVAMTVSLSASVINVALTQNKLLALLVVDDNGTLGVATADHDGQNQLPHVQLPHPCPGLNCGASLCADSLSDHAMVLQIVTTGGLRGDLCLYRTTDSGQSWVTVGNLSEDHQTHVWICRPKLFHRGKLWGVVWEDFWNPDSTQWNVYWRLSANHGKNWYPAQRLGLDVPDLEYGSGQFVNNEVRVYWGTNYDYATITGIMTPDTIVPVINAYQLIPDSILVGEEIIVGVTAIDNDTLSEVRLVLQWGNDSTRILMTRGEEQQYQATFTVPEEGYYSYRIEAEDFWENVGCDPDTGWAVFVTDGWNEAIEDVILHPSSFSLSTYPNPFNATTTLSFSLSHSSPVSLTIFNLLGQAVYQTDLGMLNAGEHRHLFDASELPSGVYLARVQAGGQSQIRKMALLK
ncbi:MAG: T9SS type A sorting domain-containing protein, partial [Calditrichota bacterium]